MAEPSPRRCNSVNSERHPLCVKKKMKITSAVAKMPYRHSTLTRVLKRSFEDATAADGGSTIGNGQHRTVIIATISPTSTDLEHTLNTLKHVSLMASPPAVARRGADGDGVDWPNLRIEATQVIGQTR